MANRDEEFLEVLNAVLVAIAPVLARAYEHGLVTPVEQADIATKQAVLLEWALGALIAEGETELADIVRAAGREAGLS